MNIIWIGAGNMTEIHEQLARQRRQYEATSDKEERRRIVREQNRLTEKMTGRKLKDQADQVTPRKRKEKTKMRTVLCLLLIAGPLYSYDGYQGQNLTVLARATRSFNNTLREVTFSVDPISKQYWLTITNEGTETEYEAWFYIKFTRSTASRIYDPLAKALDINKRPFGTDSVLVLSDDKRFLDVDVISKSAYGRKQLSYQPCALITTYSVDATRHRCVAIILQGELVNFMTPLLASEIGPIVREMQKVRTKWGLGSASEAVRPETPQTTVNPKKEELKRILAELKRKKEALAEKQAEPDTERVQEPKPEVTSPDAPQPGGIGVRVQFHPIGVDKDDPITSLVVASVWPNGPAGHAGIRAGDTILKIDDYDLRDRRLTSGEAISVLRGPIGSPVSLTVRRPGAQPTTVSVNRADIVNKKAKEKSIGVWFGRYVWEMPVEIQQKIKMRCGGTCSQTETRTLFLGENGRYATLSDRQFVSVPPSTMDSKMKEYYRGTWSVSHDTLFLIQQERKCDGCFVHDGTGWASIDKPWTNDPNEPECWIIDNVEGNLVDYCGKGKRYKYVGPQ